MLNRIFAAYIDELPILAEKLRSSSPLSNADIKLACSPGIYCFSENGRVLYLGRTENFKKRHKNHCGASSGHNSAAFAFLLAREATGQLTASYSKEKSRADLMRDLNFSIAFSQAKQRIGKMEVRFVEVADHNVQHLFELYAAIEFQSVYNKFVTT